MRGRILPSRRELASQLADARFQADSARRSLEDALERFHGCLTRDEASALVRYAAIICLASRQGDFSAIVDQAYEDPSVTPVAMDLLLDVVVSASVHALEVDLA